MREERREGRRNREGGGRDRGKTWGESKEKTHEREGGERRGKE